jgi:O-methyltransferase involved in polyketide biosynthesis
LLVFEIDQPGPQALAPYGFDPGRPALLASTGVSMYLTKDVIEATLRKVAALASGTTLAMSFFCYRSN